MSSNTGYLIFNQILIFVKNVNCKAYDMKVYVI